MAVVSLSFIASSDEITSGVPQSIEIEANVPATIYYTTDGTTPDISSNIYTTPIQVEDGLTSFTLSSFAIDFDGYSSSILTQVFSADQTNITISRNVNGEGIIVDSFDNTTNNVVGYDADGSSASFTDLTEQYVTDNTLHTSVGFPGDQQGTKIEVNIPEASDTPNPYDDNFVAASTTQYAATFNPYAKTITIDNRISNEVSITTRPWGSFSDIYREQGGGRLLSSTEGACYISGGFVRRFYDHTNQTMVSYYFDHNSCRHIKRIQALPTNVQATMGVYSSTTFPMVFSWIERGKHSTGIF